MRKEIKYYRQLPWDFYNLWYISKDRRDSLTSLNIWNAGMMKLQHHWFTQRHALATYYTCNKISTLSHRNVKQD